MVWAIGFHGAKIGKSRQKTRFGTKIVLCFDNKSLVGCVNFTLCPKSKKGAHQQDNGF